MKIKTTPLNKERKAFIINKRKDYFETQPGLADLEAKLLKIGGQFLCPTLEEDLDALLNRGEHIRGRVKMMKSLPSQCHSNAARLWDLNRDKICWITTGYGLSDDGLWRQHTWVTQQLPSGRFRIVETTIKRLAYFGFRLTKEEAEEFIFDNLAF